MSLPTLRMVPAVLGLVAIGAARATPPMYTIRDLGVVAGGGFGFGILINNAGQAVGYQNRTTSGNSPRTAVFWDNGLATDMFPTIQDGTLIQPQSLNDSGATIVTVYRTGSAGQTYRWLNGQSQMNFVVAPPGTVQPLPWDIDNSGRMAGNASIPATVRQTIVRWSSDGQTPTVLGTLGGEAAPSHMNNAGDIAGFSYPDPTNGGHIHPFVIRSDVMQDLSGGPAVDMGGQAMWISDTGLVAGWLFAAQPPLAGLRVAASWDASNHLTMLPHLSTSDGEGIAYGVNSSGKVVGQTQDSFWGTVAALWDQGVVYKLADRVQGGLPDGWVYLAEARGINEQGQIIGWGNRTISAGHGDIRAFILTPVMTCYPNCDNSTTPPVMNVLDFSCFLNRFAAGDTYANCDASTTPPVLNVLDFACFLNLFAAGCS